MQPAYIRVNHRNQTPTLFKALNRAADSEDCCPAMTSENYIELQGNATPLENGHQSRSKGKTHAAKAATEEPHTLFGINDSWPDGSDNPITPQFFENNEPSLNEYYYRSAYPIPQTSFVNSTNPTPRLSSTPLGSPQREDRSWRFPPGVLTPQTSLGDSSPPSRNPLDNFPLRTKRECRLRTYMKNVALVQNSNSHVDGKVQEEFLRQSIKDVSDELQFLFATKTFNTKVDEGFTVQNALMAKLATLSNQVVAEYGITVEKFFNKQN